MTRIRFAFFGCATILLALMGTPAGKSLAGVDTGAAREIQQQSADIAPDALAQIEALLREKETRSPGERKMDSQLLYARRMQKGLPIADGVETLDIDLPHATDGHLVVDVKARVSAGLLAQLDRMQAEVVDRSANDLRLHIDLDQVEALAARPDVLFVQPKREAFTMRAAPQNRDAIGSGQGSVTSQGDVTHRAALFRGLSGADGTGVRIGVLSDGVSNLAAAQASGDLGEVTVLLGQEGDGDEGTAMLEIIHDLAPGALLYFATAADTITGFAQNIRALRAAGCDIIVDDVGYFVETPFQDGQDQSVESTTNGGIVVEAVKAVSDDGALYFSAAGNGGNLSDGTSGVWEGDFSDGGPVGPPIGLSSGSLHSFGGHPYNTLTLAGSGPINLFWSDPLGGSSNDYDLFRLNNSGTSVLASSTNIQSGLQDPYEQIGQGASNSRIVVVRKTGAAGRFLHLNSNRGRMSVVTAGQTHGHAATSALLSFGVAATSASAAFPNAFSTSRKVETFSSDGPRRIFFNRDGSAITPGNLLSTGGYVLSKPDITAADGVLVTGAGNFSNPFSGTSAAAPHAAAIAALYKSANPSWTAAQIRTALLSSAIDIEAAGFDRDSGYGIVMATAPQPGCTFSLAPAGATFPIAGSGGSIALAASGAACSWVAWTTVSWLTITGATAGTGSTPVAFSVAPNPGGPRSGAVVFEGGQTLTVSQLGSSPASFGNNTPVSIPDNTTVESTINVSGLTVPIGNVTVSFYLTHTYDSDLEISLVGPDDTSVVLSSRNGSNGDDFGSSCSPLTSRTTFSDAATTQINNSAAVTPPFIGTFRPEESLSAFTGKSGSAANGTWKLRITDSFDTDTGTLLCWSLHLNQAPADRVAIGLGPFTNDGGWMSFRNGLEGDEGLASWARLPWPAYTNAGGGLRLATGDVDGDGLDEIVVGLGPGGNGWFAVLDDAAHNYALMGWTQVTWAAYNAANGEVWPAVGDLDGDGRAEIVVGLGPGGAGWFEVFDDAAAGFAHLAFRQVAWPGYTALGNAVVHPAIGNVNGTGNAEIILGLGSGSNGWLEVVGGASGGYSHQSWFQGTWMAYNAANGTTFPAAGDLDGDGRAEIVAGLGSGGAGWIEVFGDATSSFAHTIWLRTSWPAYNTGGSGETHPAVGSIDGDTRAEIVVGLDTVAGDGGWFETFDDAAAGFASLGWRNLGWAEFRAAGGATFPAIGKLK